MPWDRSNESRLKSCSLCISTRTYIFFSKKLVTFSKNLQHWYEVFMSFSLTTISYLCNNHTMKQSSDHDFFMLFIMLFKKELSLHCEIIMNSSFPLKKCVSRSCSQLQYQKQNIIIDISILVWKEFYINDSIK